MSLTDTDWAHLRHPPDAMAAAPCDLLLRHLSKVAQAGVSRSGRFAKMSDVVPSLSTSSILSDCQLHDLLLFVRGGVVAQGKTL